MRDDGVVCAAASEAYAAAYAAGVGAVGDVFANLAVVAVTVGAVSEMFPFGRTLWPKCGVEAEAV